MATDIVMPNLGFDTQSGRLVEWLKQPGEVVQKGEILAIVESDKANVELESIASGVLLECLVPEDTEVTVGAVIARVGAKEEAVAARPAAAAAASPALSVPPRLPSRPAAPAVPAGAVPDVSPIARRVALDKNLDLSTVRGSGVGGRTMREDVEAALQKSNGKAGGILALPKVRQAARALGIDLARVTPTGKHGEITLEDVRAYQSGATTAPTPAPTVVREGLREVVLGKMRRLIGERLSRSKQEAPHFYVTGEFDLEAALGYLAKQPEPQPRINDLIQYLTVQTLLRVPELNAVYEQNRLYHSSSVDLAIAVARDDGLITPVIAGAERYSLHGLAAESRALIQRARDNRLQPADLQGGTFTISNLGVIRQVDYFTAVINPPQVAILAVGTVKPRPVVINGGLHIRHTVFLTLSGDHRVVDGMVLARFMAAFQAELDKLS